MIFAEADYSIAWPVIVLPLCAAVLFATGALLLKRSGSWSVGVWRTTFLSNLSTAAVFLPMIPFGESISDWSILWQPLVVAVLFILGQAGAVLALTRGDVSIATPVLGLKIILVAVFARFLLGDALPAGIWLASALATAGVMLLNFGDPAQARQHLAASVGWAMLSAASFGLFDICVQVWAPQWGITTLLPLVFIMASVLSMAMIPFFEGRLRSIPRPAWKWLIGACALIAVQSFTIVCTVAIWGQAAAANVAYSSRGLWSVGLLWLLGPLFGLDTPITGRLFWFRLAGAALLLISVTLLILE